MGARSYRYDFRRCSRLLQGMHNAQDLVGRLGNRYYHGELTLKLRIAD